MTYVTPPGFFVVAIFTTIYVLTGMILFYAAIRNTWQPKSYYLLNVANFVNALWICIWSIGTTSAITACLFISLGMPISLGWLWYTLYEREGRGWKYYFNRNAVSFYFGWELGSVMVNVGFVFVHALDTSQKSFLIAYWIIVPLLTIGVTIINTLKQGKNGFKSSIGGFISIIWILTGSLVTAIQFKDKY